MSTAGLLDTAHNK